MRRVQWKLFGVMSVVLVGWGVTGTGRGGVAAGQSGQAQGPSAATAALLKDAIVVDGHVHITELGYHLGIDPWKVQPTGTFDYARAKQGGLNVVIHAVYTIDGYNMYNYGVKHALRLIQTFYKNLDENKDKMELALTSADARRIVASGKMAAILALENNPDMEGDLDVLRMWYRLGVRMMQLTSHNSTNALVDARIDEHPWKGLSDRGRVFVREMNRLGIIVDASHSSEEAHLQIIAASQAPVVDSHTRLKRFTGEEDGPRGGSQMSDDVFNALAAKGGMIGMLAEAVVSKPLADWQRAHPRRPHSGPDESGTFVSRARRSTLLLPNKGIRPPEEPAASQSGAYIAALDAEIRDEKLRRVTTPARGDQYGTPWRELQAEDIDAGVPMPTPADWAEHALFVTKLVGDDHVGIGLDLMAKPALRDFDATQYWRLAEAMLAKGMSPGTIKKVLGENWLRLLDQAKVPGLESSHRTRR